MRRLFLAFAALFLSTTFAYAQAPTKLCITTNGDNCIQVDATNPLPVTGGASGVATGGVFNTALPTLSNGASSVLQLGVNGGLLVNLAGARSTGIDAVANAVIIPLAASSSAAAFLATAPYNFNGTTWDRVRGDTNGTYVVASPSAAAAVGITPVVTSVAAGSLVVKATPGNLYSVQIGTAGSAGFLMMFNATSAPADGTVTPVFCKAVAANTTAEFPLIPPAAFSTGITAVFSTTGCFTKTISATAFISGLAK